VVGFAPYLLPTRYVVLRLIRMLSYLETG